MQHFPSITEGEFHHGCRAFYERVLKASDSVDALQVTSDGGVLSIKTEYVVRAPHASKEETTDTVQDKIDKIDQLTDEDDDEVRVLTIASFLPNKSHEVYLETLDRN